jgi:hypothetical protein
MLDKENLPSANNVLPAAAPKAQPKMKRKPAAPMPAAPKPAVPPKTLSVRQQATQDLHEQKKAAYEAAGCSFGKEDSDPPPPHLFI